MIPPNSIAVILAGGKSSRMQRDKALLPFGEVSSLAEFQYRRLSQIFSKVYISSKNNKFDFDVEIIEDIYESSSPLVALVSIFEALDDIEEIFLLSVDTPFVDKTLIDTLYKNNHSVDVVVAESNNGLEPLCAIYHRSCIVEAKRALELNRHKLHSLFEKLDVKIVKIENEGEFINLNYPSEYEEAQKKWYARINSSLVSSVESCFEQK